MEELKCLDVSKRITDKWGRAKSLSYEIMTDDKRYDIVFISLPEEPTELCFQSFERENKVEVYLRSKKQGRSFARANVFHFPKDADLCSIQIQSRGSIHLLSVPRFLKFT